MAFKWGKVSFSSLCYLCFIVRSRHQSVMPSELKVCFSNCLLFTGEVYSAGEGKKASHFLSTLFIQLACHKVNHSKPVIQFPVSWSQKEYIFNLPVQHMFSGEGDFCHEDYFRAASKHTVCGCLSSEWRNMQRTYKIGVHALGNAKHVAYLFF